MLLGSGAYSVPTKSLISILGANLGYPVGESRNIKALAGINDKSIALELFKHSIFKSGGLKPNVSVVKDTEIEDLIGSDVASIAILSRVPENSNIKVLMVSSGGDTYAPAFGPTDDNVHYGDYPIRLSFYILYNARDDVKVRSTIRELLNDEVATSLRANDFIALPDTLRRKFLIDLDLE